MSGEKPNALREEQGGDEVMNMIREGLQQVDRAKADMAPEPDEQETDPGTKPSETPAPESEPQGEPEGERSDEAPAQEESEPGISLEAQLAAERDKNERLRKRLGDSGNQVGDLRGTLAALGDIIEKNAGGPTVEETVNPIAQRYETLKEKYGEDFAKDMLDLGLALTADVRSGKLIGDLKSQFTDFGEHEEAMAELLRNDPELRAVVAERPNLLRVVYQAAKGSTLGKAVNHAEKKGVAMANHIAASKKNAYAERPGGSQNKGPVKATREEIGKSVLDKIISARQDGRRV